MKMTILLSVLFLTSCLPENIEKKEEPSERAAATASLIGSWNSGCVDITVGAGTEQSYRYQFVFSDAARAEFHEQYYFGRNCQIQDELFSSFYLYSKTSDEIEFIRYREEMTMQHATTVANRNGDAFFCGGSTTWVQGQMVNTTNLGCDIYDADLGTPFQVSYQFSGLSSLEMWGFELFEDNIYLKE